MNAESATLQKILYASSRYIIPVFQRYYTWGPNDWERLWSDILELREPEQEKKSHFMGSLVFVPEHTLAGHVPNFQVVDGQQRLTTLSLLLCALRDYCISHGFDRLADELVENYVIHKYQEEGENQLRISPRQRDRTDYLSIALASNMDSIDPTSNPSRAYHYFLKQIQELLKANTLQEARDFFDLLRLRLGFVSVTLDAENPYQIFKSLNSTGVDLSESDLIRNFVFMHTTTSQQDQFDDNLWRPLEKRFEFVGGENDGQLNSQAFSGFFRDFLMLDGAYVKPDAIFQTFEEFYASDNFDPVKLTKQLTKFADFYSIIHCAKEDASPKVTRSLEKLSALKAATTRPLLLNLMDRVEVGSISSNDLAQVVELLSGFVFRRLVCGEQSRSYGYWFVAACKELKDNPVENLRHFLKGKGFPTNATFESRFVEFKLYSSTGYKSVLAELEYKHPNHVKNEAADLSKVEVEHIMPQTLTPSWNAELGQDAIAVHGKWLHTPGNLTLTGYNQSFGNKPFSDKSNGWADAQTNVPGYKNSNIAITKEIALQSVWTETEIENRAQRLAKLASSVYVDSDY